jgi:GntR family transcriptional regulator/MocR family aminotransferase
LGGLALEPAVETPLYRQLYDRLREAILTGRLAPGTRLPPTRSLADELAVSRNTVINAFNQLMAEGYLEGNVGRGTFVSRALPEDVLQVQAKKPGGEPGERVPARPKHSLLSKRGAVIAGLAGQAGQEGYRPQPFRPGVPALDLFPLKIWERLARRRWRSLSPALLSYGHAAGYLPLRQAIAAYLGTARGVRCEVSQVLIVGGAQQAIDLTARVLLDVGDEIWFEEPGYPGARAILLGARARLVPVPVDEEGLVVEIGRTRCPGARLAYITPSHQYPLGVTMSLRRRLALLEWAAQAGSWILEDDYDSEYRYIGRPLAALQGLDPAGRVIYVGTFSKVLFPGLRLGYLVVPPGLVDAFVAAAALTHRCPPGPDQAILADFIEEGHFARHIRRMRTAYVERQVALVEAAQAHLGGLLELSPTEAGLHMMGWLPEGSDDQRVAQHLLAREIEAPALTTYSLEGQLRPGLVLGYAGLRPGEIRRGVRQMAVGLKELREAGERKLKSPLSQP